MWILVVINCDLKKEVEVGCFWVDFYYRLSVYLIYVLLLCECKGDFFLFVGYFVE